MDPLDFLEDHQLVEFFHCNKTEMSCMEKPQIFLNQLRDHNLIPDEQHKKVSRMKNKTNGVYYILDCLETQEPQHIRLFWKCVFRDSILAQYPKLLMLRNSLMDGSYHFYKGLPKRLETKEREENEKEESPDDKKSGMKGKTRKRQKSGSVCSEEEQPGQSVLLTLCKRKRSQKPTYGSPLKKGENEPIWTWPIYKTQLPVSCGDKKGILSKSRLARADKCIMVDKIWYSPSEFQEFAGKESCKNWKLSIRCMDATLLKLLQDGHLTCPGYKKAKKSVHLSDHSESSRTDNDNGEEDDSDEEQDQTLHTENESSTESSDDEEREEGEPSGSHANADKNVFNITCGALSGTLHKARFATDKLGKCIRTEECWMSPEEFATKGLSSPNASWKKDILSEGKPLNDLLKARVLVPHSLLCMCLICSKDLKELENQRNDDECFVCRLDEEEQLVVCEQCPRSFHQKCHLPQVDDRILQDDRPWLCTFCVFKENLQYTSERTHQAALQCQISQHLMECQHLLLSLYNADRDKIFFKDPNLHVKGYNSVIKTPMWLDKVAENLEKKHYQTVEQFESDMQLIFTNCARFNRDNAEIKMVGEKLKEFLQKEFKHVFCIQTP